MSQIRQDPTTKEWVIIARERSKRPSDFVRAKATPEIPSFSSSCPFCPGNESMAVPETLSYWNEKTQQWRVRAFANKFPALTGEESNEYYLWHLRIIPRLTEVAGFEIGSGIYITTALPEKTAQFMHNVKAA